MIEIKSTSGKLLHTVDNDTLVNANLYSADLRGADLRGADLRDAYLRDARMDAHSIVPSGDLVVYKLIEHHLIRLAIPKDARRMNAIGSRKCRAEYAAVLQITAPSGHDVTEVTGGHNPSFLYRVGETVLPDSYDDDIRNVCSHGIHFFVTEKEAREYA